MPTQPGKVASFIDVDVVVEGPLGFRVDGYDDGTSISLAPQGDRNTVRNGNDGIPVFAESLTSHEIWTLSLFENSDSNDDLDAWLQASLTQKCTFLDRGGRTIASGLARVRQKPTVTKSAGVESRSWDIHVVGVVGKVGGLNNPDA